MAVYSYGNYDERDLKLGGWLQKECLLKHPVKSICYFVRTIIKKHYIFIRLVVTSEQMDDIHAYLEKILAPTKTWEPTSEAIYYNPTFDRFEEMYVYFMAQQMDTVFYKFNRSKFMTCNGWTRNCLSFADHTAKVLHENIGAKNMVFRPNKRLQNFLKKNSPLIIHYEVY